MLDLPVYILTLHCSLASVSVDINGVPIFQSIAQDKEIYKTITLDQHLLADSNKLTLGLKNDWGLPTRDNAACEVQVIKSVADNYINNVIANWNWKEKEHSIGFSKHTELLEFTSSHHLAKEKEEKNTPNINQVTQLLQNIQVAIEQEDSNRLINDYFKYALNEKHKPYDYTKTQWQNAELSYWQSIFSNKVSSQILSTEGSITQGNVIHLLTLHGQPVLHIKMKDEELFLDITVIKKGNTLSVYSVEYIHKTQWKK